MKNTLIVGAVVIVVLTVIFFMVQPEKTVSVPADARNTNEDMSANEVLNTDERIANPDEALGDPNPENEIPPAQPIGKLKVANFTGTLEKVDVGCFADGECFVKVDGKHVTTVRGWSQEIVGSVIGVDGFGDLEQHIGKKVEVYAQDNSDGTYTLYGNKGFYVKLVDNKADAPKTSGSCIVGGCSGQLCVDAAQGDVASTCEYRDEYACYKTATCERQQNGQCGWTQTATLNQCLNNTL